jgi:hypothetical protein
MTFITIIAGFVAILVLGYLLRGNMSLLCLCFFCLLLSAKGPAAYLDAPYQVIGALGSLVTLTILTYQSMWEYHSGPTSLAGAILICAMLALSGWFAIRDWSADRPKALLISALTAVGMMRFIWALFRVDGQFFNFICMGVSNLALAAIGVGFILHGAKQTRLPTSNVGLLALCTLIMLRFFDSGMDFLWRGVVFLALGAVFLLFNLRFLRIRKHLGGGGGE